MDTSLGKTFSGRRLHPIRVPDLEELAHALVAAHRHRATVAADPTRPGWVQIVGQGFDVSVNKEDWAKIFPFLADGSWDCGIVPLSKGGFSNPGARAEGGVLTLTEGEFFNRVLDDLKLIFTETFPTSTI